MLIQSIKNKTYLILLLLCMILPPLQADEYSEIAPKDLYDFISQLHYCQNGLIPNDGRLLALLVGLDQPNLEFAPLTGPEKEIGQFEKLLKKNDYAVKTLAGEAATKRNILNWLACLADTACPHDRLLFYFTGHASTIDSTWSKLVYDLKRQLGDSSGTEFVLIPRQPQSREVSELIFMEDIIACFERKEDRLPINQRIIIIDGCFGGYFINVSPITCAMFQNTLPPDGFYALTSLKAKIYDGQYFPCMLEGLRGAADIESYGNKNGRVSLYELNNYLEEHIRKKFGDPRGEDYYSRFINIGSGEVNLTQTK